LIRIIDAIDDYSLNAILQSDIKPLLNTYINAKIKSGSKISATKKYADGLKAHIIDKFEKEISKLKTERGKSGKRERLETLIDIANSNEKTLILMFLLMANIADVKQIFINKLNSVKMVGTFLDTPDGFKVTSPEGFVAIDHIGKAIKLVDRLEFSRANFNTSRF